jgi:hypothetical protein
MVYFVSFRKFRPVQSAPSMGQDMLHGPSPELVDNFAARCDTGWVRQYQLPFTTPSPRSHSAARMDCMSDYGGGQGQGYSD